MSDSEIKNHQEGHFYKGLFYGVVLGLGLAWFFGTKSGQKLKHELLSKGEEIINQAEEKAAEFTDEEEF